MPRSCICQRLLARAASDAAFRLLPDSARLLWFEIVAMASAAPVPGRLRFLHSVPASVARLATRPETEIATQLRDLAALGLVDLDEDGVTLWLPGARDGQAKAEAARRNGLRGGAPRKGETKEAYRERRQREMLFALPAGAAEKPDETQAPEAARPATTTVVVKSETGPVGQSSPSPARAMPDWVSLGAKVAELAGLDGARGGFDFRPVQAWLAEGATPDQVRAAVRAVVARASYSPQRVKSLKYFDGAVAQARAVAAPAARIVVHRDTPEELARLAALQARIDAAIAGRSVAAA